MTWRDVYFLPEEVAAHCSREDCWITIHGVVKNVTGLIERFWRDSADLVAPILREAGQDVSHWFDLDQCRKPLLKTHLHPETGARMSLLPFRLPHEPVYEPDVSWSPSNVNTTPWWRDEVYNVGLETAKAVEVHVMNPLIKRCATMRVCAEDTVCRILERYSSYNPEVGSYTIKYLGKPLCGDMNLRENGVMLGKDDDSVVDYVPILMLHYRQHELIKFEGK